MTGRLAEAEIQNGDLRDVPAYSYVAASKALRIPASTLRAWTKGQMYTWEEKVGYFQPVIRLTESRDGQLSYHNLIEAFVLRALRTVHRVSMGDVREALRIAEQEFGIERLLIHEDLRFGAGELFLKRYSELVSLTASRQLVMDEMLRLYLSRVEYDEDRLPVRLFPLTRGEVEDSPRIIEINPFISFGRPIVASRGISTSAIQARIDAGETVEHVAKDYDLTTKEVEEAIRYEVAA